MNSKDLEFAKALFIKYNGSHFQMEREGDLKLYKTFNVSKDQELAWIRENQLEVLNIIKNEDVVSSKFSALTSSICQYKQISSYKLLLNIVDQKKKESDSFTLLRIAEELFRIYESFSENCVLNEKELKELRSTVTMFLGKVLRQPFTVHEYYQKNKYMISITSKEKVFKRAELKLNDLGVIPKNTSD